MHRLSLGEAATATGYYIVDMYYEFPSSADGTIQMNLWVIIQISASWLDRTQFLTSFSS